MLVGLLSQEFSATWDEKCHRDKFGVNASDPCSVLVYLSEVRVLMIIIVAVITTINISSHNIHSSIIISALHDSVVEHQA